MATHSITSSRVLYLVAGNAALLMSVFAALYYTVNNWQRYVEKHILTIARQNSIKAENLCWACAVHNERDHPHVHIVFWDKSAQIRNLYTHPAIPNNIRKQLTWSDTVRGTRIGKDKLIGGLPPPNPREFNRFGHYR